MELPGKKELSIYQKQLQPAKEVAEKINIASLADMQTASDILHRIADVEKALTARKELIVRPWMDALSAVRDLFKPLEKDCAEAKKTIKGKMVAFQTAELERVEKEKERIEIRVQKGTMRMDTGIKKMEGLGDKVSTVRGTVGRTTTRILVKVRIIDQSMIPHEYMMPDMTKITEAVIRNRIIVPGVERYEEKSIVIQ